jgi:hypothetical protein
VGDIEAGLGEAPEDRIAVEPSDGGIADEDHAAPDAVLGQLHAYGREGSGPD